MRITPAVEGTRRGIYPSNPNVPVALYMVRLDRAGNAVLKIRGRLIGFCKDPANLFGDALKQGEIIAVEYSDRVVIGVLKNGYKKDQARIVRDYKTLDRTVFLEEIETVYFAEGKGVRIEETTHDGPHVNLARVSPAYAKFETTGHVYTRDCKATFSFLGVFFELSLEPNNAITRAAKNGTLLMSGGPLAETIEFWDTETDELLYEIPVEDGYIATVAGQRVSLEQKGMHDLGDFWPAVKESEQGEVAKPAFVPRVCPIPVGSTELNINYTRITFDGDMRLQAKMNKEGAVLTMFEDRVEVVVGAGKKEKHVVYLDTEGYVLGTDKKRFCSARSGDPVRIHRDKGDTTQQFLLFWQVALKRDLGVFEVAKKVSPQKFAELVRTAEFAGDDIYVVRVSSGGKDRVVLEIEKEEVPLTNPSLRDLLYNEDLYLILKKVNGQVVVSAHAVDDKHYMVSFGYSSHFNRFFWHRKVEEDAEREFVDLINEEHSLEKYKPRCFLDVYFHAGSVIYVKFDDDQEESIPQVRNRDSVPVYREEIEDMEGNYSYLYGTKPWKGVLTRVRGWVCGIPLLQTHGKEDGQKPSFGFAFGGVQVFIPESAVERWQLAKGSKVDFYDEYGAVSCVRHGEDIARFRTLRDRNKRLIASGAGRLTHGLLEDGPSVLENIGPTIVMGKFGVKVGGGFLPFFLLGEGAKSFRMRFFEGKTYSAVAGKKGEVLYWAEKEVFDAADQRIIDARLLLEEKPETFEARAQAFCGAKPTGVAQAVYDRAMKASALNEIAGVYDWILSQLGKSPFNAVLLSQLMEIRSKLILLSACFRRKRKIEAEIRPFMVGGELQSDRIAGLRQYVLDKELTALEIAFLLQKLEGIVDIEAQAFVSVIICRYSF
ncbi:MAG: hypothetical protein NT099_03215 [Candidatus Saganbacteria bacterium]|nr:hypothetical protein [Candidatus Saganbacteria bacterium]